MSNKPKKKTSKELYALLDLKISNGDYVLNKHARQRQLDRSINDLEILDILEGKLKETGIEIKIKRSMKKGKRIGTIV